MTEKHGQILFYKIFLTLGLLFLYWISISIYSCNLQEIDIQICKIILQTTAQFRCICGPFPLMITLSKLEN